MESEQLNGSSWSNGSEDGGRKINLESLTLMLAHTVGPDPAISLLEECGVQPVLSAPSKLVFELLRVTEKRQRWVGGTKWKLVLLKNHMLFFKILLTFDLFQSYDPDDAGAL